MTLVIAHRGASAYAPENTMPAFELAIRQGADMVELDVQRTADGRLVVFHDEYTERWDGRKRRIAECTLPELQALDIGGARVATLAEVCALAREHNLRLNVEIKGAGFGTEVANVLRTERIEELVLISSFYPVALKEIEAASPHLPRAYLMGTQTYHPSVRFRESWPLLALRQMNVQAWHPTYRVPLVVRILPIVRRAGYMVNVWTVNDPAMMRRLINQGADGIITDTPDVLRRILNETRHSTQTI